MKLLTHPLSRLTVLASVAALYACGGGGGSSATGNVTGSATGVFTDAAIQGASYTTSSGVSGVTDANGNYKYNPGDTVTFKLGSITLGSSTANGIISPIDLAAGDANKYRNLLVLVQSLDADGNPGNGITIAPSATAALPSSLNLAESVEANFSTAITSAVTASGSGGVVTGTAANAHFLAQALPLLSSNVYTFMPADHAFGHFGLLRIDSTGAYLEGEVGAQPDGFMPGVELGSLTVDIADAHGFHLVSTRALDTNGTAGVNNLASPCQRVVPIGSGLYAPNSPDTTLPCSFTPGNAVSLKKAANDPTGIVGVWANGSATVVATETFVFTADGHFLMVDPVHSGIESGTYSYNKTTQVLKILSVTYDTNGSAGLSNSSALPADRSVVPDTAGMIVAVNGGASNGGATLFRISK